MGKTQGIPEDYSKKDGFSVPEDYFDQLPSEIESTILASAFPATEGFNVPNGYFDTLSGQIANSVTEQKTETKILRLNWWTSAPGILAVAASVVVICLIGLQYWTPLGKSASERQLASEYLADHIDQSSLEDALAEESDPIHSSQDSTELAANEEIVNYLIDSHIETSVLEHELKDEK